MANKDVRIPPQDLDAEQSVLGALMIDKSAIASVDDILAEEDFYKKAHGIIYGAILKLWGDNEPIDILSVTTELKRSKQLNAVGGSSYLTELVNAVPTASHIAHYAKIVKEKSILRDLIKVSSAVAEDAFGDSGDLDQLLDEVEQKIFAVSQKSVVRYFSPIKDDLKEAYERIEKLHHGEGERFRGVPTGFTGLDNLLSGLQRSEFIVVGARPSFGKTSFVLDIARHVAVVEGIPVGVFSLEMSREQVIDRFIAAEAQVDLWKLRTGRLNDERDFGMIQSAFDKLNNAPLFIDDTPSPNIVQIRSMARRLKAEYGQLGLIVVDYLQLIQPRNAMESIVQQVTETSRGLKGIARELDIPVLAVSQLSRAVDQREVKIPRLSDLRESGSIEQDADVVMFIYPKDAGKMEVSSETENITEIIIAKHRNGPQGTVRLYFDKQKASFQNIDETHQYEDTEIDQAIR
ncbi:MAG: replicative DNA helicase [Candidatus Colwellbacteria bacterium RIFCSPHIGHO2_02_FULL_45_17]|uniref:Replicative DNA helicase n=3 Tax=Parcubacteria group TaxID=1794811 RepID=A0A0H4T6V4_9BACT|nr:replicative DNA helicase, replicative DNA helicase [uncultured Parcubacteria bacterium Rifle_16ft_4_minimus_37647]OGY57744.1 MAG: replicative DNA helicase [Candidatus Colwellbacteria bacterium RIFCSPHIGHO2_02_FULL_45_17]OGY60579.1 MAG: replicative DNA helicase [Candidatus Colwellbacteria bacterium RIFCSPLOWO2_02_FULL_45_11]OGY62607.1 MAG: replicative DNA helicase [Candidatus Colwellbacteria bacterium RIFCSPLOWO2_12_FULL_46_17]